jgi:hypothetical protein
MEPQFTGGTTLSQGAITLGVANAPAAAVQLRGRTLNGNNISDSSIGAMAPRPTRH